MQIVPVLKKVAVLTLGVLLFWGSGPIYGLQTEEMERIGVIHQTSRTLRGVGSTSRRPGRAQTKDVILNAHSASFRSLKFRI